MQTLSIRALLKRTTRRIEKGSLKSVSLILPKIDRLYPQDSCLRGLRVLGSYVVAEFISTKKCTVSVL